MWHGDIILDILLHPVFVQRVRRQVNPVVPIDASAATIHLHLLPKVWHQFQQSKLPNLLHILPHIIHHRLPIIKHNRKTVIRQSLNTTYSWQSIHYSNGGNGVYLSYLPHQPAIFFANHRRPNAITMRLPTRISKQTTLLVPLNSMKERELLTICTIIQGIILPVRQ